jgi:DNA replication protein DnaC
MQEESETQYLISVGILRKWHPLSFDDFKNDKDALDKSIDYVNRVNVFKAEGIGYFYWGANGTGKSLLLNSVFKRLVSKRYKVRIITFYDLITLHIGSWNDDDKRLQLERIKNVDFLGIEEIGKELQAKESDVAKTVLDNLVRYRVQMNKPTFITSNKRPSDIAKIYTEDINSMLKECCIAIQVTGDDYRETIKNKNKTL